MIDKVKEQKELMKNIYEKDVKENKKLAINNDYKSTFKVDAKLFYWFYPVHVYVLYGVSILLYMVMQ